MTKTDTSTPRPMVVLAPLIEVFIIGLAAGLFAELTGLAGLDPVMLSTLFAGTGWLAVKLVFDL